METKRKLPTKDQWQAMDDAIGSGMFGRTELVIDGYPVTYKREMVSGSRIGIMTYVDGFFRGKWINCDAKTGIPDSEEGRRFCRIQTKKLTSKKKADAIIKVVGKRVAVKEFGIEDTISFCMPDWKSFRALKKHLLANNSDIEIVSNAGF